MGLDVLGLLKSLQQTPQLLKVQPAINWFLLKYMRKFKLKTVGGNIIIHSHLPPINSRAFSRFVNEHLISHTEGPSHAQVGLTNACPQKCVYCYNRHRGGQAMDTATIKRVVQELKELGVFWLGFTGGEPLLNRDIVRITECAGNECSTKLFTTGMNLTRDLANDLRKAGLVYVSVSLDHWKEEEHDKSRGCPGAYRAALKAIEVFKNLGDIHVSVSAVLSRDMIENDQVEEFLEFLEERGIHEAWLSETKPSIEALWEDSHLLTEEQQKKLVEMQDRYNQEGRLTVNYLGHFEDGQHFGCSAGYKMIYVDAFGEVSPCVFTPLTFGSVKEDSVKKIWKDMKQYFPSDEHCFINKNYQLIKKHYSGQPMGKEDTLKIMEEVRFGSLPEFYKLYYRGVKK